MKIGLMALEEMAIEFEWQKYNGFLEVMEPYLSELTTNWNQEIEDKAQELEDEEERSDFFAFFADDYENFRQFNVILANSFFSTAYFFFEHSLMMMCQRTKTIHDCPFAVTDINARTNLDRAKKYMKRLGVQFPSNVPEWSEIKRYNTVRNAIAHNGGIVLPNWRACELEFVKRKGILAGAGNNTRLELTRSFCEEALVTFQRFLVQVARADPWRNEGS